MTYDKKQVADRLCYWREFMQSFHLPTWEELPDLELYMDQVVSLVIRYVNLQPHSALKDSILTASAVNNYVRLKLIPPPVKKRYSRIHLAYLIVICCLKGVYEPVQHSADVSYEPVRRRRFSRFTRTLCTGTAPPICDVWSSWSSCPSRFGTLKPGNQPGGELGPHHGGGCHPV